MTDRDRLIELLNSVQCKVNCCVAVDKRCTDLDNLDRCQIQAISDYLIENGVIVPPCKVGDTVYRIVYPCNGEPPLIVKGQVLEVAMTENSKNSIDYRFYFWADGEDFERRMYSLWCWWSDVGKTVFLTREEAEKFLEELNDNGN